MLFGFDIGTIGGVLELPEFQKYVNSHYAWTEQRY
jgi:hypothetical protein